MPRWANSTAGTLGRAHAPALVKSHGGHRPHFHHVSEIVVNQGNSRRVLPWIKSRRSLKSSSIRSSLWFSSDARLGGISVTSWAVEQSCSLLRALRKLTRLSLSGRVSFSEGNEFRFFHEARKRLGLGHWRSRAGGGCPLARQRPIPLPPRCQNRFSNSFHLDPSSV